jgi:hypothetical protein
MQGGMEVTDDDYFRSSSWLVTVPSVPLSLALADRRDAHRTFDIGLRKAIAQELNVAADSPCALRTWSPSA